MSTDTSGRLAGLTNIRKPPFENSSKLSRGHLVRDFLSQPLSAVEFISQLKIVLDPYSFGAGTVFYQCMACGVPVITKPTSSLKTRVALGGYRQMRLTKPPIARSKGEYIEICKRLVKSKDAREKLSAEIKEKALSHLFNSDEVLIEYEMMIRDAVKLSRENKKLPKNWKADLTNS